MALTPEDKKDVKTHLGKALANKVSKVTRDDWASKPSHLAQGKTRGEVQKMKDKQGSSWTPSVAKSKALQGRGGNPAYHKGDLGFMKTGNLSGRPSNPKTPKPKQNMSHEELVKFFK